MINETANEATEQRTKIAKIPSRLSSTILPMPQQIHYTQTPTYQREYYIHSYIQFQNFPLSVHFAFLLFPIIFFSSSYTSRTRLSVSYRQCAFSCFSLIQPPSCGAHPSRSALASLHSGKRTLNPSHSLASSAQSCFSRAFFS